MSHELSFNDPKFSLLQAIYFNNTRAEIISMALDELLYQSTVVAPHRSPHKEVPVVLIEIRNPEGIQARCDASCYDSDIGICDCCCGKANHGVGLVQALSNMPAIVENQVPEHWIRSSQGLIPEGCTSYALLPMWIDVPTHDRIAAIARILQVAREERDKPDSRDVSNPVDTR